MGYKHYVGYIPKSEWNDIQKEIANMSDKAEIQDYLQHRATIIVELGRLYRFPEESKISNLLYDRKTEDYSSDDCEFFFVDNDNEFFLANIAIELQQCYVSWEENFIPMFEKLLKTGKLEINHEEKLLIEDLRFNIKKDKAELEYSKKDCGKTAPYNDWQYNYEACRLYTIHRNFDYYNNMLCVFAY